MDPAVADLALVTVASRRYYVDRHDVGIGRKLAGGEPYEGGWVRYVETVLRPGMFVIDVGANFGYYTVLFATLVRPGGRVFAFEPEARNWALLERNVQFNALDNVMPVRTAVLDRDGEVKLFVDREYFGSHSVNRKNSRGKAHCDRVTVAATTLDGFIETHGLVDRIDFVKLDAQGAEGLILAGARRLLSQQSLSLLVELWPYGLTNCGSSLEDLLHALMEQGFRAYFLSKSFALIPVTANQIRARARRRAERWASFNVFFRKPA